jgi:hypothetical protein
MFPDPDLQCQVALQSSSIDDGQVRGIATGNVAIGAMSDILKEREKTKRLLIGASCLLFIVSALVVVFAPPNRWKAKYAGLEVDQVASGSCKRQPSMQRLPLFVRQSQSG